jgi:hypothetical protein
MALALCASAVASPGRADAATLLYFKSEPGDYIGQGQTFTLTPANGTITTSRPGGGVEIAFNSATSWWYLDFVPPAGAPLAPGVYEGATRFPFQSPTAPGLDVSGNGRGCNTLTGRFVVLEAVYGAGGSVDNFAADYEQHCEGGNPALFGSVRINSNVPLAPRLSVGAAAVYEGDTGVANLTFTVSLSAPAAVPVTVQYSTSDGTATAGIDYTATSGTASFPVGETAFVVNVPVVGDTLEEANETFTLVLANPGGASIAFGEGQGTILNDDPYKTLIRFNSQPGDYIGGGQKFTVTPVDGTFTGDRAGEAVHIGFDGETWWDVYLAPVSGLPLVPGVYTGATRWPFQLPTVPGLDVSGDGRGCNTLTGRFSVLEAEYGPAGQVLRFAADYEQHCEGGSPALFGSVRFNSAVPLGVRVAVAGSSVLEGNSGTHNLAFPIWLSEPAATPVTVNFATADGTAVAGVDYAGFPGSTGVPAGAINGSILVPVFGDTLSEADETFTLTLTGAVGAALGPSPEAVGTILNDDAPPQLSVSDTSVTEGQPWSPPSLAVFTVSLSAPSGQAVSVGYATQQGTATVNEDFVYTSGTLSIPAGSTSATVSVPIRPDLATETDETFSLGLFSPTNATIADGTGVGTIVDDDPGMSFHTLTPCRFIDTRLAGPPLAANTYLTVGAAGSCGIPLSARAVALNVTAVAPTDSGHLRLYPGGTAPPPTSALNFASGQTRGSNAIVGLGQNGGLTIGCYMPSGATHVVLDVFGYFE